MEVAITEGIKVTVDNYYMPEYSVPDKRHYVFGYKIKIENLSAYTVQLLRRNWEIFDIVGDKREVIKGDGVIGQTPIIDPGEFFEYVSGCHFISPIGKMKGTYEMKKVTESTLFDVEIPEFTLQPKFSIN
ncbi:Co2+/Mg2+ efflux protein ApaG [Flammeovirga yaeyamensis]|uniref:Co2+/Mg2+ efflux protein ApaG n=1 Tax=Flammeovirga yaeyamensis TaxID=367791 RepID=A0AAX1NDH1_9BACT|nr:MULTISPECIES: Co2+/Mg2+ efflux protein ApaG [Flammeovirga]ANQ48794.1 Co2+/Mg2+ efflux protein ApaG [Flammeovirga sp. MY04]MBB3698874.1 ApaG protein [Flammeovirga yaeyamensis]NMF37459.1 Co2+/Mg2+ efflux protein ApaG [Flammeovirga yaeyamensis]QWG03728.1 Co2+/Mg2+ efflux protein ApaG [Flammeovirga yaeyamensis]